MLAYYHAVRPVARRIEDAISHSVEALREGRVEHEPAMTDRMLGAIEESLTGFETHGIRWAAKTLTDRGRDSQESQYGADFLGVLSLALPGFEVSKGFLAQAKMVRNGRLDDLSRLKEQCEKMLSFSSASFVFLYTIREVRVVPALSVVAAAHPLELYSRSSERFFEEHLQCFIGDRAIHSPTPAVLGDLRARFALLIQGEYVGP